MRTEPAAFDMWLRGVLIREFGKADNDALPEELLRLLPQDKDGPAG